MRTLNKIWRLIECLYHLGWSLGYGYWKFQNQCQKNPDTMLEAADNLEEAAVLDENREYRWQMQNFAIQLRRNYKTYIGG